MCNKPFSLRCTVYIYKPYKTGVSYGYQALYRGTNETAFSTVHRVHGPYKTAVSCGSQVFSRGTNATAVSPRCTV